MKKFLLVLTLISMMFSLFLPTVNAEEFETIGMYIDGEYYEYLISKSDEVRNIYIKDASGNLISYLTFEDDAVYEKRPDSPDKVKIAIIETTEEVESPQYQTRAIEPNWGPLLTKRTKVTYPNPESTLLTSIVGILVATALPGSGITSSLIVAVAQYIMDHNIQYVDQTAYYHEAIGCPQYRWYKKYEYRDPSGKLFKTVTLNKKSFIGVTHSPQNPPACTMYGF